MEEPTDKETTTPPEELEQSVTTEPSNLAADEVRRWQRTRTMIEKARENKITTLTNSFWKLHGKFAREIIQTTMGKFCTKDTLGEMEVNLVQWLQEIEHIYGEVKMLSTAAPDQTTRMAIRSDARSTHTAVNDAFSQIIITQNNIIIEAIGDRGRGQCCSSHGWVRSTEWSSTDGRRAVTFRNGRDSVKSRGRRSTPKKKKSYRTTSRKETASRGVGEG